MEFACLGGRVTQSGDAEGVVEMLAQLQFAIVLARPANHRQPRGDLQGRTEVLREPFDGCVCAYGFIAVAVLDRGLARSADGSTNDKLTSTTDSHGENR